MRRSIRLSASKEEKVAVTIGKLLADFTLDLEAVGKYLATSQPYVIYARALEVLEATEYICSYPFLDNFSTAALCFLSYSSLYISDIPSLIIFSPRDHLF